jgi:uncharacterized protein YjbJ (UPF0337 family)
MSNEPNESADVDDAEKGDNAAEHANDHEHPIADRITGLGQQIIGGIEEIGGILTGDPVTAAEGEFNVEVGEVREEIEEDLEGPETGDKNIT